MGKQPPSATLGNYAYDSQRDTYYPKYSMKQPRTDQSGHSPAFTNRKGCQNQSNGPKDDRCNPPKPPEKTWRSIALPAICHLEETCPSKNRRLRMRDAMTGRILFSIMQVVSAPCRPQRRNTD